MHDWIQYVRRRLKLPTLDGARSQETIEEVAQQLEDCHREALARGLSEEEAIAHAKREIRDWDCFAADILRVEAVKRQFSDMSLREPFIDQKGRPLMLGGLKRDLFYALRSFRRSPSFALIAIVTLALGIGANTAIFSVVNAVLLRPYPYKDPDRLVVGWTAGEDPKTLSVAEYLDIRDRQRTFSEVAVLESFERGKNLTGSGDSVHAYTHEVSPNFFSVVGVEAFLGRSFGEEDLVAGRTRVVVLEHNFWMQQFGGKTSVLDQTIRLNDESYTVLGVMPPNFEVPEVVPNLWVPLIVDRSNLPGRASRPLWLLGRLKENITREQASEDLQRVYRELASEYPGVYPEEVPELRTASVQPVNALSARFVRSGLLILLGTVGVVLLITCVNVTNLLLSRAVFRKREVAVRAALGAGRLQIVRQLITESTVLSVAGGCMGVLIAYLCLSNLIEYAPVPRADEIGLDLGVLGFTFGVSVLAAILVGLVPALQTAKVDVHRSLKEGGRSHTGGTRMRWRNTLVVAEIGLVLSLLLAAGLLLQSFNNLLSLDPGFRSEKVQTFRLWVPETQYPEGSQVTAFYREVLEKIRGIPGVAAAGAASRVQLSGTGSRRLMPENFPQNSFEYDIPYGLLLTDTRGVTPGYFDSLQIPLLQGRDFQEADTQGVPYVLIVDETFAREAWPGETNIVGKAVAVPDLEGGEHVWLTVVGLVRHAASLRIPPRERPQAYYSHGQAPFRVMHVTVRSGLPPETLLPSIHQAVAAVDADIPPYQVQPLEYYVSNRLKRPRFYALMMGLFALVALGLGVVGLYGVISSSVSQRTHEIGVRMALGLNRSSTIKMVLGQSLRLFGVGTALGLTCAFWATRLLSSLLFEVGATDPLIFSITPILLGCVSLLACYIPARRATKVDPIVTLRYE